MIRFVLKDMLHLILFSLKKKERITKKNLTNKINPNKDFLFYIKDLKNRAKSFCQKKHWISGHSKRKFSFKLYQVKK
jgi:hypothetical protein